MKYRIQKTIKLKYALMIIAASLVGIIFLACKGTEEISESDVLVSIPKVIDKQIWFINDQYNDEYRAIPSDPGFIYCPNVPTVPSVQPVPFPWEKENFYSGSGNYITGNIFVEPGKPWVLQLVISTPGKGDTSTGSPQYKTWYRVSKDGGKTFSELKLVVVKGHDTMNPIKGVKIGRNGFNIDFTRPIVKASNGEIMVPLSLHPWDEENQKIYLPVENAYLFGDAGVLVGKWLPDGSDVTWDFGEWLRIDYNVSTRGVCEATIIETKKPGKFAMVARCSNLARPELPGYARVSFSNDYCRTWSEPKPLTYTNGENFFVPTAHSTLFRSRKSGRVYWVGNITETNPQASHPRYPLVIAEVNTENFGLIKESVVMIDTRHEHEDTKLQLSNFNIMENVEKEEIIIVCKRYGGGKYASHPSWYRIKL
ncbi:exo-alpha-sialidase [Maribellus luteus]|uniref:Exo-alpha-sialidase n=1 Tax=Maribellus luteus TaxID=2305463 RepID=A0A399SXB0_9BACT|nr:sialidase family protein [Maribellus luteus]RIJ46493.1 exo-alpha-sialidase [Maribellus luteus]